MRVVMATITTLAVLMLSLAADVTGHVRRRRNDVMDNGESSSDNKGWIKPRGF